MSNILASDILVALDDGHGLETAGKRTPFIKELGRAIHENEFNSAVVKLLAKELKRCGIKYFFTAPTDEDTSLSDRVNLANSKGANLFQSIHFNAYDGSFEGSNPSGFSVHVYSNKGESYKYGKILVDELKNGTEQINRGLKLSDFYVLRETNMMACLSECGFMDNPKEALLMLNEQFQLEVAQEHCKAICKYFGVEYVEEILEDSPKEDKVLRRVQCGAYSVLNNAIALRDNLVKDGFSTYLIKANNLYKVQCGAFSVKKNADALEKKLKAKGYSTYQTTNGGIKVNEDEIKATIEKKKVEVVKEEVSEPSWKKLFLKNSKVASWQKSISIGFDKYGKDALTIDSCFGEASQKFATEHQMYYMIKHCYNGVVWLQKALKRLGLYSGRIDGSFGSATKASVLTFQKLRGLKVDGYVGLMTTYELLK